MGMKPPRSDSRPFAPAAGLLLFALACNSGGGAERRGEAPTPSVEAVAARQGALPLVQRLSGVVKATNQVAINPEIGGVITEVLVCDGDAVKKGQPLLRLRDKEYRDRLAQAAASLQIAEAQARQAAAHAREAASELARAQGLAAEALLSQAQLEAAETKAAAAQADVDLADARVAQAKAGVSEQEQNLAQTVIRAPVAGRVGGRNAEVGMRVDSGTRLFTLGQLDHLIVEIGITDTMLAYLEVGQPAELLAGRADADPISARLVRISPFLHPVTHSTEGELEVANPDGRLSPGMFVTVDVFYGESQQATLVPLSALYEHPATGATGVYVTEVAVDKEALAPISDDPSATFTAPLPFTFVPVQVIATGRMAAGIAGVEPGQWVVTIGQHLLGEGTPKARVRPVKWDWVEKLQSLQREDLLSDAPARGPSS